MTVVIWPHAHARWPFCVPFHRYDAFVGPTNRKIIIRSTLKQHVAVDDCTSGITRNIPLIHVLYNDFSHTFLIVFQYFTRVTHPVQFTLCVSHLVHVRSYMTWCADAWDAKVTKSAQSCLITILLFTRKRQSQYWHARTAHVGSPTAEPEAPVSELSRQLPASVCHWWLFYVPLYSSDCCCRSTPADRWRTQFPPVSTSDDRWRGRWPDRRYRATSAWWRVRNVAPLRSTNAMNIGNTRQVTVTVARSRVNKSSAREHATHWDRGAAVRHTFDATIRFK